MSLSVPSVVPVGENASRPRLHFAQFDPRVIALLLMLVFAGPAASVSTSRTSFGW